MSAPKVDRMASEVVLRSEGGARFEEGEAEAVRNQLALALEQLILPRHPEDYADARYRVVATLEREGKWSYMYIVLAPLPFLGAPIWRMDAKVELRIQIGDATYRSEGTARVHGGFWYNYNGREKATAKAFRAALRGAMESTIAELPGEGEAL